MGLFRSRRRGSDTPGPFREMHCAPWTAEQEQNGVVGGPRSGTGGSKRSGTDAPGWSMPIPTKSRSSIARRMESASSPKGFPGAPGITWSPPPGIPVEPLSVAEPPRAAESSFVVATREGRIGIDDLAAAIDRLDESSRRSATWSSPGGSAITSMPSGKCAARGGSTFLSMRSRDWGPLAYRREAATGIDFLAADGHKWLLGPEGAGLLYIRRDWIERLRPIGVGWHSVVGLVQLARGIDFSSSRVERWEGGSFNMAGPDGLRRKPRLAPGAGPEARFPGGSWTAPKRFVNWHESAS